MPWFRRGWEPDPSGVPDTPPANPDAALSALSVQDAVLLVELARDVLREVGRDSRYDGAGQLLVGEFRLPLAPMASVAATASRHSWRALVRRHVHNLLEALAEVHPQTLDEARTMLLPRLRAALDPGRRLPAYAEEVLPGVAVVAALDYTSHIVELMSDDLIDRYGGRAAVMATAMINLHSLAEPTISDLIGDPDRDDSTVHLLRFEDFFGASRLLRLPELLAGIGVERPRYGVLLAVPHRHLIALHVVRGEGVVSAMRVLARLATGEFRTGPGPLSPHVYFWLPDGSPQQVTWLNRDAELCVTVTGPLAETLGELGLSDHW